MKLLIVVGSWMQRHRTSNGDTQPPLPKRQRVEPSSHTRNESSERVPLLSARQPQPKRHTPPRQSRPFTKPQPPPAQGTPHHILTLKDRLPRLLPVWSSIHRFTPELPPFSPPISSLPSHHSSPTSKITNIPPPTLIHNHYSPINLCPQDPSNPLRPSPQTILNQRRRIPSPSPRATRQITPFPSPRTTVCPPQI